MVVTDKEILPKIWVASLLMDGCTPCNRSDVLPNVREKSGKRPAAHAWHARDTESGEALVEGVGLEEILVADFMRACENSIFLKILEKAVCISLVLA